MDFPTAPATQPDQITLMFARLVDNLSDCHARHNAMLATRYTDSEHDAAVLAIDEAQAAMVEAMRDHVAVPKALGDWAYYGCRGTIVDGSLYVLIEPGSIESTDVARVIVVPLGAIRGLEVVINSGGGR